MFIHKDHNSFYLAEKVKLDGTWKLKHIRGATEAEIRAYHIMKRMNLATLICDNPNCDRKFQVSRNQKLKWNTLYPRQGKFKFKYCSKTCQQEHMIALRKLK